MGAAAASHAAVTVTITGGPSGTAAATEATFTFTFTANSQGVAGSRRFHAAAVDVRIDGTDRKDRFQVTIGYPGKGAQTTYTFDADAIDRLRPLLERVRRAAP